jgi:hypothetical protein
MSGDAQCLTVLNNELHGAVSVKGRGGSYFRDSFLARIA